MLRRLNPFWFLLRLVGLFLLTFLLWRPIAPAYTNVLFHASRAGVWLSEFSLDAEWSHGTTLLRTPRHPTGIFYKHRKFDSFPMPLEPQGIPAEWVMANLLLLIPLMLATPAPTWAARFFRLGLAMVIALAVQVTDVVIAIKAYYSSIFIGHWGPYWQELYGLLDSFVQGFDTQLFPFVIWAGIHFRELIQLGGQDSSGEGSAGEGSAGEGAEASPRERTGSSGSERSRAEPKRAERRRKERGRK